MVDVAYFLVKVVADMDLFTGSESPPSLERSSRTSSCQQGADSRLIRLDLPSGSLRKSGGLFCWPVKDLQMN